MTEATPEVRHHSTLRYPTAEAFAAAYAEASHLSVGDLAMMGREPRPCDCGEELCDGWQMAHVGTPAESVSLIGRVRVSAQQAGYDAGFLDGHNAGEAGMRARFERALGPATVMLLLGERGPCPHGTATCGGALDARACPLCAAEPRPAAWPPAPFCHAAAAGFASCIYALDPSRCPICGTAEPEPVS